MTQTSAISAFGLASARHDTYGKRVGDGPGLQGTPTQPQAGREPAAIWRMSDKVGWLSQDGMQNWEGAMTSFRRLVMGIAEVMQVISIILVTLVGGIFGGASGAFRSGMFAMQTNVTIEGLGQVASVGAVFGFVVGAMLGFVFSATLAGIVFTFVQIERNTRSLLENRQDDLTLPGQYRTEPQFDGPR